MQYTGTVVENEEKDAKVLLKGVNGTPHTNVQIKVKITGPATPKLLAKDSNGVEHDIAQIGYWGPPTGFPVQGDFTNTTPIKATFTEAGKYTIELSLVDLTNNNSVITSKTFTIDVSAKQAPANNTVVDELPKTGTSIWEYLMYTFVLGTVFVGIGIYFNRKKLHN